MIRVFPQDVQQLYCDHVTFPSEEMQVTANASFFALFTCNSQIKRCHYIFRRLGQMSRWVFFPSQEKLHILFVLLTKREKKGEAAKGTTLHSNISENKNELIFHL